MVWLIFPIVVVVAGLGVQFYLQLRRSAPRYSYRCSNCGTVLDLPPKGSALLAPFRPVEGRLVTCPSCGVHAMATPVAK
jgi:DNA-directed RNA polymerase subunit RPC12/RpoP